MAVRCSKCQSVNREGSKFCKKCGNELESKCPSCGYPYQEDSLFCDECGYDLRSLKGDGRIDYSRPASYTPRFLADKILRDRGSLEGERKLVTVLFADTANYTAISEKLDPEEVRHIMDGCIRILMDEIHRCEGTVTLFTGDGAMALFGAPVAHEDHAQRACHAALGIQKALEGYGQRIRRDWGVDFKMRVGLNSGPVIVGSVGSDLKMDYTAIGDTVNLASRLENAARPGAVLVSGSTYRMSRDFFRFRPLGKLAVKGKEEPVEAYDLLGPSEVASRIEAAVARGLTRFVGREREMDVLGEAFEKARSGSGQVVGIVGEAGVGKSRLLLEMKRKLPDGEHTYLQGRCLHYGDSTPYLPFLDMLRSYFDIDDGDRESAAGKLAEKLSQPDGMVNHVLAPLEDVLSLGVHDEAYLKLEPPLKRVKIFEAIRDLLIRGSQNKTLVIAVEDLHWIDRTSEELLGYLIGFLANTRILLILLYRPEYNHQWGSRSYYRQIGVGQLSPPSSAELIQSILEEGEIAPELGQLILNRTAGNPLFMEEFTRTLLEKGCIERKDCQYVLSCGVPEVQVPDTIQGIIGARMDRLEENMKRTLQVASVIGRDFAFRILQTVTGMREELKSYLMDLQGLEFIYEKSLFPELEYIFKHALIQEVAYGSLLVKRRKEIHERIGKAIEAIYPDRLEEFYEMLAYHYSRSDDMEKAYHYLRLSSIKGGSRNSTVESVRFGKQAIDVLDRMPQSDETKRRSIEIRLLLSGPLAATGQLGESLQMMEEGARLAEELGDNTSLANLWGTIGLHRSMQGDALLGVQYAEKAFGAAKMTGNVELIATNGWELCVACTARGEHSRIAEVAPELLGLLEEKQLQKRLDLGKYYSFNLHSAVQSYLGHSLGNLGHFVEGQALCEEACKSALELGHEISMAFTECLYAPFLIAKGDGEGALEHIQKGLRHAERGQFLVLVWLTPTRLGHAYYLLGELGLAREQFERRLDIYQSSHYAWEVSWNHYGLGLVHLDAGELEAARTHIEQSLQLAMTHGERDQEGRSKVALGRLVCKMAPSRYTEGEECILQGIGILEELRLKPYQAQGYLFLGGLYADAGQGEKALRCLKKAQAMFQEMGMEYWLARAVKALDATQTDRCAASAVGSPRPAEASRLRRLNISRPALPDR